MADDKEQTVEERVLAFAHQLGRLIGTVERKAEGWMDREALNRQVTQIRLSSAASSLRNASLRGRPSMTVTIFPPRPFFSMRSFATIREGSASLAFALLHWQFDSGQPQRGHIRPFAVE